MTKIGETDDNESLRQVFDRLYDQWAKIERDEEVGSEEVLQGKLLSTLKGLEQMSMAIVQLGLFGVNEVHEELEPSHLRFMLTPLMSARLLLRLKAKDREELLHSAEISIKDFLVRLKLYEVIQTKLPFDTESENVENSTTQQTSKGFSRTSAEVVLKDSKLREETVMRYKQEKALESKFGELQKKLTVGASVDEDVQRELYLTELQLWAIRALNELKFIESEKQLVAIGKQREREGKSNEPVPDKPKISLKPFILTRSDAQKKVFGAGYPALPTLTVEEWYQDKMAKEAHAGHDHNQSAASAAAAVQPQTEEEADDAEKLRLRAMDEYKDTHRTGWGNTYNQG